MRAGRAIAGLSCLLLGPVPAGAQTAAPATAAPGVLIVRGNATVTQAPDVAHVALTVVTTGPTLDAASRDHAGRVTRAAAVLAPWTARGATVDQGSFDLVEASVPDPQGRVAGREAVVFRAETRYDVTVTAIDRLDALLAGVAASGLFEVGPTTYAVADETASVDRVRRAAMADALHQAEVYAEAGGVRLDGIERIADGDASGPGGGVALAMRMAKATTVGSAPPRLLTFQGGVSVTWRIAPR